MKYMTVLLLFVLDVKSFNHFLKISGNVKKPSQYKRISSVIDSIPSFQSSTRGRLKSIDHYDLTLFLMRKLLHHNENKDIAQVHVEQG